MAYGVTDTVMLLSCRPLFVGRQLPVTPWPFNLKVRVRDTKWLGGSCCGRAVALPDTGCDTSLWLGHWSNTSHSNANY